MNDKIAGMAEFFNQKELHFLVTGNEDCILTRVMAGGVQFDVEIASWDEHSTLRFASSFPVAVGDEQIVEALILCNALNRMATFGTFTIEGDWKLIRYRSSGELGDREDPDVDAGMLFERHLVALSGAACPLTLFALGILTGSEAHERIVNLRVPPGLLPVPESAETVRSN